MIDWPGRDMAEAKKHLKKTGLILAAAVVIGYLLLVFVYLIPTDLMYNQVVSTAKMMESSKTQQKDPCSGRLIDNFADSQTILLASYPGEENVFEKAACSYHCRIKGESPRESLVGIVLHDQDPVRVAFGRYWHGSMVFIKPLLLFFDLAAMRNINTVFLFLLIVVLIVLMRKELPEAQIPFLLMILLMGPTTVGQCFEYTFAVHIMLITCILYLWNPKGRSTGDQIYYLFLFAGIALGYFDFLTAPTITLTVPLAFLCMKEEKSGKEMLLCTMLWFAGYAGMWVGKLAIALLLQGSSWSQLTEHFALWATTQSVAGKQITRFGTLNKNFEMLFDNLYLDLAILGYAVVGIIHIVINRRKITPSQINRILSLYFPGMIGIAWILTIARHSNVHTFFTYRTLAPCVFCLLCALRMGDPPVISIKKGAR